MAELGIVFAIVSIVSSTTAFLTSTSQVTKKFRDGGRELKKQLSDIKVLCKVLEECEQTFSDYGTVPESIERCLLICVDRHADLMEQLSRLRVAELDRPTGPGLLINKFRLVFLEDERKAAYNAFRDSVLLLRDLSSELRTQSQLIQVSASLAELMSGYDDEEVVASNPNPPQESAPPPVSEQQVPPLKGVSTNGVHSRSARRKAAGHVIADLIKQNFTRDTTIVVDRGAGGPERLCYIPVRAKMDTGCDDNLIHLQVLQDAGINDGLLIPIQSNAKTELIGIEGFICTPEFEIELTWYQDRSMKVRKSKFLVVKDAPFDILIGSHRFAQDLRNPGLLLARRAKTNAELEQQASAEEVRRREEEAEEQRRVEHQANQRRQARAQAQAQAPAPAQP